MKDNGEIDAILEVLLTPNPLQAGRLKTSHTTRPQPRRDLSHRPRSAPTRPAERDRSGASVEGDHQSPSRTARKPYPPQSFLSERRLDPAEPPEHPAPEFVWLPPDGIIAASVQQSLDPDLHLHRAIGQPLVSAPDRQGIGVVSPDRQLDVVLIRLTVVGRI